VCPRRAVALCVLVVSGFALVPAAAAGGDPEASDMMREINEVRARHGFGRLRPSDSLERSSFAFARHLMRTDRFGHAGRIHADSRFRMLGEALAYHSDHRLRKRLTLRRWMGSPPHRALILSRGFRWIGAGYARGGLGGGPATIWVLHLGRL
jgi:uncharacterized protein YkwD